MNVEEEFIRDRYVSITNDIKLSLWIGIFGAIGIMCSSILTTLPTRVTTIGSKMFAAAGALMLLCCGAMLLEAIMTLVEPESVYTSGPVYKKRRDLIMGWMFGSFLVSGIFLFLIGAAYTLMGVVQF